MTKGTPERRARTILATAIAAVALAIFVTQPAYADRWDDCNQDHDDILAIEACTAEILSGMLTQDRLAIAHFNRAVSYMRLDRHDHAIRDYDRAIGLLPDYRDAIYNRGNVHYDTGSTRLAILDFDEVLRIDPGFHWAYWSRGNAHCKSGRFEKALADWNRAFANDPAAARQWQEKLKQGGLYTGPIDGKFGPGSRAALRAYADTTCRG